MRRNTLPAWMTLTRTYPLPSFPPQFQSCQDISGIWLVLEPLTTYYSNGVVDNEYVAFEFDMAQPNTPCNYFGEEYYHRVQNPQIQFQQFLKVALTAFPGYLGAKEGDNQFLSFVGASQFSAPGNVEVCPGGQTAKIYRDDTCLDGYCTSKSVMRMAKFPDPNTQIVGKTHSQLVKELEEQTGTNIFDSC